jgi:acetyltransferase-like isoleucine patch superfamily enzyme
MLNRFVLRIKRKENRFFSVLYHLAKFAMFFNVPCVKFIHLPLYYVDYWAKATVRWAVHTFWSVPLFKARCQEVGKNLRLPNGIPFIQENHLKVFLGDNVTIYWTTIGVAKLFDEPVLKIGNDSSIGFRTLISISKEVDIGEHCLIGPHCIIMDNDSHPLNPQKRLLKETVDKERVKPVRIGKNVWLGAYSAVLPGVTIGDNTVVATHSVVTTDAAPNCVYAGFPAKPILRDIDKT